jgi:hypothetical protein
MMLLFLYFYFIHCYIRFCSKVVFKNIFKKLNLYKKTITKMVASNEEESRVKTLFDDGLVDKPIPGVKWHSCLFKINK